MTDVDAEWAPASSAQRGLWLADALDPGGASYVVVRAFELAGRLDEVALASALSQLIARHGALRTGVVRDGDQIFQRILTRFDEPVLRIRDLTAEPDPTRAARALVTSELVTPFDLTRPPLVRAWLAHLGPERAVLIVSVHHAVVDERSLELMWQELSELYGTEPRLVPAPAQYADYARWEQQWLASESYREQLERRCQQLEGSPTATALPDAVPPEGMHPGLASEPSLAPARGAGAEFSVARDDVERLLDGARRHGATPFTALLAMFCGVLHRWTAQPDVVVGVPMSTRDRPDRDSMIGMLVNTVPVRTVWADNPTLEQTLARARTAVLQGMSGKRVPFDQLVSALPALRERGRTPIVQVAFGYSEGDGQSGLQLPGVVSAELPIGCETSKFDLSVDCALRSDGLLLVLEWNTRCFDREMAGRLAADLGTAVAYVSRHSSARVGDWPLARTHPAVEPITAVDASTERRQEAWVEWLRP